MVVEYGNESYAIFNDLINWRLLFFEDGVFVFQLPLLFPLIYWHEAIETYRT
jgi:hypothetical protein